jgi:hypothetical protein
MSNIYANIDANNHVYYPTNMFKYFDNFPYVVRFDTKQLRTANNADKIRAKLLTYGLKDLMVYPLRFNSKSTNSWEVRFKTEADQQTFIINYGI